MATCTIRRDQKGLYYNASFIPLENAYLQTPQTLTSDLQSNCTTMQRTLEQKSNPLVNAFQILYSSKMLVSLNDVRNSLYDICDQGQYLDGKSDQCLQGEFKVESSANRCFVLSILASLKAKGQFSKLSQQQAEKLHSLREFGSSKPNQQLVASQEMLGALAQICDLGPILVAIYNANAVEPGSTVYNLEARVFLDSQLEYLTPATELKIAHILQLGSNHYVALLRVPDDCALFNATEATNPEGGCSQCSTRPRNTASCAAVCKTGRKCGNLRRLNYLTCAPHKHLEADLPKLEPSCEVCGERTSKPGELCGTCKEAQKLQQKLDKEKLSKEKQARPPAEWKQCPACTFLNDANKSKCDMCGEKL